MFPRIYDGSGQPAPERVRLQAGPLTMDYEAGLLRYIRLGNHEVVRGIYAAVRDQNWGTVPGRLTDVQMDVRPDSFTIRFTSDHRQNDIHFRWQGIITGAVSGEVTFTFDGEALSSFKRNRIGFCVLHPVNVAGAACAVEHVDGEVEQGTFPQAISPHQPFFDIRAITHEVMPGLRVEVRMEGDTFEMEDQRNWTDASFKTYCTPLGLPFPVQLQPGDRVQQRVTVRLIGTIDAIHVEDVAPMLALRPGESSPLPGIGLCVASHGEPLTAIEIERLKALHLSHLRVELDFTKSNWQEALQQAWQDAQAIGARLETAAHLDMEPATELAALREVIKRIGVQGWLLVFRKGERATSAKTVETALDIFANDGDQITVGAGTNGFFTEQNRNRLPETLFDGNGRYRLTLLAYSVNPQVHAFDNASLVETLPVLRETLESARRFAPVPWLAVTPITFKIRWNPNATAAEAPTPPGELPRRVDPRQMSLFGAGWTLGTVAPLAQGRARTLTYYETTGWLGVMERATGSPLPDLFPSIPGGVYPMYHVFADIGEFAGGEVEVFESSHPLSFTGLALKRDGQQRLLIANHTQEQQTITVEGLTGSFAMKLLDETNADAAMRNPKEFRSASHVSTVAAENGRCVLTLPPYSIIRLDSRSNQEQ